MEDIKIIIDTNAEQAGKSFDDLGKSFENTTNDAEDLRKQIRELKGELFKLTPGTEEYGRVLEQLGSKMNQLGDTTQELRVATGGLDTVFQTTTQATATMAAGFTAASGVVALFGGNTEDLQKTFVKLQAVMAITTGLKGFAAFEKMTKRASISLKAYIAQMKLARTATQQQTASTAALATAEGGATVAATGLGTAIKGVTAAIAANPIGAVLVAITAAITAITHFVSASKEAKKQAEEYNAVLEKSRGIALSLTEELEKEDIQFNLQITRLKTLGATQEEINDLMKKHLEQEASSLRNRKETLESLIDYNKENTKAKESLEKWGNELEEVNSKLKDTQSTLDEMAANTLPKFAQEADESFAALERSLNLQVLSGNLSEGGKVSQKIEYWQQRITDAQTALAKARKKRALPANSPSVNEQLDKEIQDLERSITAWGKRIIELEEKQQENTARAIKSNRDAAVKLAQEHKKNYQKLNEDFNKDYDEMYKTVLGFNDKMIELYNSMGFSEEESRGKARNSLSVVLGDIDNFTNTWRKKAEELVLTNKISSDSFNMFLLDIENNALRLQEIATHITDDIELTDYAVAINNRLLNSVKYLKEGLTTIDQLRKEGLINEEQYQKAYIEHIEGFKSRMADDAADIEDYFARILSGDPEADTNIDETLAEFLDRNKLTVQQYVDTLKALFEQSGTVLPPEFAKSITDSLSKIIDAQFNDIENKYKKELDAFQIWQEEQNRSWLEGGDTKVWGNSTVQRYNDMQKQAEDLYKLLHAQYEEEKALLKEKMSLLDENSEAWQKYNNKLQELRDADIQAEHDYDVAIVANRHQAIAAVMEDTEAFTESISGLASAMGSYYAEQAAAAKETYGENSEEYKKYIKKEGAMKIHQVWADFATGVMKTWAGYADFGPLTYVLAGIQTAALLATAIASTQQIRRETNATASGGQTTANVGQLTDRVIMAEAQNTDQTAQLNASYNQGATRVFVTVDDINNGQNANRTAVTNNTF